MQNLYDTLTVLFLLFTAFGGFYYFYGLSFIFAFVGSQKNNAGKTYRGWFVAAAICLVVGLATHLSAGYVLSDFYIPG